MGRQSKTNLVLFFEKLQRFLQENKKFRMNEFGYFSISVLLLLLPLFKIYLDPLICLSTPLSLNPFQLIRKVSKCKYYKEGGNFFHPMLQRWVMDLKVESKNMACIFQAFPLNH